MRSQMTTSSGRHVPNLLQFVLLIYLAISTDSTEVPLHANRGRGTSGNIGKANIMLSARCRLGNDVGCSIPVYVPDGLSGRSRNDLLFHPRYKRGKPRQQSLSQGTDYQTTHVSDSRQVATSATVTPSYHNHIPNFKSDSTSLSIISGTQVTGSRPQGLLPAVEQTLSKSVLPSSSNHSDSPHPRDALDKPLLKDKSDSSNHLDNVTYSVSTSGKDCRQVLRTRRSASTSNFRSLFSGIGRLYSVSRRLAHVSRRTGCDVEGVVKARELAETGEFIPIDTVRPTVNITNRVERWKAPPLESGALFIITVAQSGVADFSSIQKAVDSVPNRNTQRVIIQIRAGTYREKVTVPYNKPFITFHGDNNGGTVVSWNATASSSDNDFDETNSETQYESKFGRMEKNTSALFGTMHSASVTILSDGFVAQHIVFQNSARPPEPGAVGAQAVAFLIAGDRAAFYYCTFLGAQDTLYDYTGRHYYLNCYIEGSIDFIFGNGRSLFEGCHLHSIAKSFGAIAAHQRVSPEDDTGFSFHRCSVTGSGTLYLGRAWSAYARIVFARTYFENIISAEGWSDFGDPHRQRTTFFGQYQCTGPGANLTHRAPWAKLLTDNDVLPYLGLNFVNGKQWLSAWPMGALKNGTAP